jgi:hypothetical protein
MATRHAKSGELIDVRPYGCNLPKAKTRTLVKSKTLEILRLVMPVGKVYHSHEVPGESNALKGALLSRPKVRRATWRLGKWSTSQAESLIRSTPWRIVPCF